MKKIVVWKSKEILLCPRLAATHTHRTHIKSPAHVHAIRCMLIFYWILSKVEEKIMCKSYLAGTSFMYYRAPWIMFYFFFFFYPVEAYRFIICFFFVLQCACVRRAYVEIFCKKTNAIRNKSLRNQRISSMFLFFYSYSKMWRINATIVSIVRVSRERGEFSTFILEASRWEKEIKICEKKKTGTDPMILLFFSRLAPSVLESRA